jgi:hypothetical protein
MSLTCKNLEKLENHLQKPAITIAPATVRNILGTANSAKRFSCQAEHCLHELGIEIGGLIKGFLGVKDEDAKEMHMGFDTNQKPAY